MKPRNKKTGEIVEAESCNSTTGSIGIYYENNHGQLGTKDCFETLAELNEEWEDYKPAEPLIKDEKIRKAVRAWAEANAFTNEIEVHSLNAGTSFSVGHWSIEFIGYFIYDLKIDATYTITELCGSEE